MNILQTVIEQTIIILHLSALLLSIGILLFKKHPQSPNLKLLGKFILFLLTLDLFTFLLSYSLVIMEEVFTITFSDLVYKTGGIVNDIATIGFWLVTFITSVVVLFWFKKFPIYFHILSLINIIYILYVFIYLISNLNPIG